MQIELNFHTIGEQIKKHRKEAKLSLQNIKSVNYSCLSQIENWLKKPKLIQIKTIFSEIYPKTELEFIFK